MAIFLVYRTFDCAVLIDDDYYILLIKGEGEHAFI